MDFPPEAALATHVIVRQIEPGVRVRHPLSGWGGIPLLDRFPDDEPCVAALLQAWWAGNGLVTTIGFAGRGV